MTDRSRYLATIGDMTGRHTGKTTEVANIAKPFIILKNASLLDWFTADFVNGKGVYYR